MKQADQPTLFQVITVHCFFGYCPHTESGPDPGAVHDRMEAHYQDRHRAEIDELVGRYQ